jgi:hypothetical protein
LFGLLGLVVAAPLLATAAVVWRYTMRKMLDLDPWPEGETHHSPPIPGARFLVSIRRFIRRYGLHRSNNK